MARRNGQLFEILTSQASQKPAQRKRAGRGGAGSGGGNVVDRALGAARSVLSGLETRQGRAAGQKAKPAQPAAPVGAAGLGSGATTLLIAALVGLTVGFGIGRWTGGDSSAHGAQSVGELRSDASGPGVVDSRRGQQPHFVDPSTRGRSVDPLQLSPEQEFEALSQFGFVLLGYPASQTELARQIMVWLRSQSFLSTRLKRIPRGEQEFVAVVVYTDESRAPEVARQLRELKAPDFAPQIQSKLLGVLDRPHVLD